MDIQLNKNVILIAVGVALLLLLGVAGFLLVKGAIELNSREAALQTAQQSLQTFYRKDPFPSQRNMVQEQKNVKSLVSWFGKLLGELGDGQITSNDRKPSKFKRLLEDKRKLSTEDSLTRLARANSVALPEDFGFGFQWYVENPDLPSVEDVPILTEQLLVTEALCKVLFEEHVKELLAIEREEFELEKRASTSSRRPGSRPTSSGSSRPGRRPVVKKKPGILDKGELHTPLHFKLVFKARQETLVKVLNRLAAHEMFIVVTGLDVRTDFANEAFSFDVPTVEKLSVEDARQKNGEERLVSGPRFETPMQIALDVDVYKFAGE